MPSAVLAYIGLGSNLGEPHLLVRTAMDRHCMAARR
jgi:7,8-dihydro-6-hydroxymethylpterin-pyrophosphokinase